MLFILYIFHLFFLINLTTALDYAFCHTDTVNCTYQLDLPDLREDSCVIHQTNVCRTMSLSPTPVVQELATEDDAPFEFSLTPYWYFSPDDPRTRYAFNMTLENRDPGIAGFFYFLQQRQSHYNSCRVFDFSEVKEIYPNQMPSLNYDCYSGFDAVGLHVYHSIIRAVPTNQEFQYSTYLPRQDEIESARICDWVPVALLNTAALAQRKADVKFSSVRSIYNIDSYSVKLHSGQNKLVEVVPAALPEGKRMHHVVFSDVPGGTYDLTIVPNMENANCTEKVVLSFQVPAEQEREKFPWHFILVAVFLMTVFSVATYFYIKRYRGKVLSRPRALILYSEDCPEHMNVVLRLYEYLKECCSIDVILDKWHLCNQTPEDWIPTMVQEVDFVILLVSRGVKHKVDFENKPEMIEKSPWGDLFLLAYRWLLREIGNGLPDDRLVKVIISPYCQSSLTPKKLRSVGKKFYLTKDMNRFLCHIHNKSVGFGLKHFCLSMPGSQHLSYPKGKQLQKAIDAMKALQDSDPNWFEGQLRETSDPSPSASRNPRTLSVSSDSSTAQNQMQEFAILLPE